MLLAATLPQGASPVVVAQAQRHSSMLRLKPREEALLHQPARILLVEARQLMEGAQVSLANSADGDLIMAEDLEEDLAAAAAAEAAAAAAEEMAMATKSTTWTARPGTKPATDDFLSRPPSLPSRRRRRCKSFRATTARRAGRCGARR